MAKFTLAIECDNAAFDDEPGAEIARILKRVANNMRDTSLRGNDSCSLHDYNGNKVGHWHYEARDKLNKDE